MDVSPSLCSNYGNPATNQPAIDASHVSVAPGTRHYTLLNSNEPPDDSELLFIDSVISSTDVRLTRLDDEISDLQEKLKQVEGISNLQEELQQLEAERASLCSYRALNSAILSQVRRMPTEVLGEIFSWTLRSKVSEALDAGRFDMERSPWLLTQISSRWRAVSLSTPSLWSRIAIDYSAESAHYSLALVKTQIERAKALRIHFYACSRTESVPQSQMWELLSQHSLRWEELSVGITWDMLSSLPALHDRLSSLKRLWIQWEGPENPTTVPSIDCFQSTPSLVEFAVNTFIPVAVGLHQLTRYQFVAPWLAHRCMLEQTWNLVEAYIINFDDEPWLEIGSIINLPSLRRLHLSDPKILNYLRAPSLEGLFFWVSRGEPPDILVESFLDRCACPLRRLGLSGFPDAHTTTQMLQKFPSITELVIVLDDDDARTEIDSLISTLTVTGSVSGSSAVVAPQLSSLFFGCEDDNNINYQMFLRMLKSRWEAEDCALKNAALVTGCCGPDPATLGALCALRQEGLDLLLRSGVEASEEINGWLYATTWN